MASSEITIKIENIKELEAVQKEIDNLKRKVSKYHRLYQQANGKAMRYARTRERLFEDKLFFKRKIRNILSVLPEDANWHNATDYIVHFKRQMSAHAQQANHYQKLYNDLTLLLERLKKDMESWRKNSMSLEKVQDMTFKVMLTYSGNGYLLNDDLTQEYVNKFIEEWRKDNDC